MVLVVTAVEMVVTVLVVTAVEMRVMVLVVTNHFSGDFLWCEEA